MAHNAKLNSSFPITSTQRIMDSRTSAAVQSVQKTLDRESDAMDHLARLYHHDEPALASLAHALNILYQTHLQGGKIVACGIGKSYKIAAKTAATLKSLLLGADVLHPSEALHGDLGLLQLRDCVVFFSASGSTPELLNLLPHMPPVPIVLLTCARRLRLAQHPQVTGMLYAALPEHLSENTVHGVPAPTILAALTLALADAVALAVAEMVTENAEMRRLMFSAKHPGGAIGEAAKREQHGVTGTPALQNGNPLAGGSKSLEASLSVTSQMEMHVETREKGDERGKEGNLEEKPENNHKSNSADGPGLSIDQDLGLLPQDSVSSASLDPESLRTSGKQAPSSTTPAVVSISGSIPTAGSPTSISPPTLLNSGSSNSGSTTGLSWSDRGEKLSRSANIASLSFADRMNLTLANLMRSVTSRGSYASLLSLSQLTAADDTSATSSLASSDCDEPPLANSQIFARSTALRWSEVEFLRTLALYDVLVLTDGGMTFAADCASLRAWYRHAEWTGMAEPMKLFRVVEATRRKKKE